MKYILFYLNLTLILNLNLLNAQTPAVIMTDRGTHYELILDYTTGISHYEMGRQIIQNILQFIPDMEQRADKTLADLTFRFPYDLSLARMNDVKPQVPQDYMDEIEGIASIFCSTANTIRNDGKMSKDELYMSFLSDDIFSDSQCSSISVFGQRSESGSSITARLNDGYDSPDNYKAFTQSVITIKTNNHSYAYVGNLSIGAATGFNDNGIFIALHSSNTGKEYTSKNKRSYMMDVRYALEHFSTSDEIAEFFISNSQLYIQNRLIQLTDETSTRILELNFSGDGSNMHAGLRTDTSTLNPGITWGFPGAIATANAFVLQGNTDNHTIIKECYARWNTFKTRLPLYGNQISLHELKELASFDNGDGPGLQADGDIYNVGTQQITIFQPDSMYLEIAFKPKNGILPDDPIFEKIPVYIQKKISGTEENSTAPDEFILEQNYPNPFNATTDFEFRTADFGLIKLKIYDILGNEIATLMNDWKAPGKYKIQFDAGNLSTGVYFYRIEFSGIAGSYSKTNKMVLLK